MKCRPRNRRDGQAVNLDWMTGLSLFMVAVVSTTFIIVDQNPESQQSLEKQAEEVAQNLEEETELQIRKTSFYVRGPHKIGKIPTDTDYRFPEDAESAIMNIPSEINESEDSIVTITESGNQTHHMAYFFEEMNSVNYENDLDTGEWMNNSKISVKPSSTGLDSLRVNNKEALSNSANFQSATASIEENDIYAEAGRLKVYNGSRELILEQPEATFYLKNFTDLYWGEDDNLYNLTGTGQIKKGQTSGLTLATYNGDDYGITFTGDLEANISKPDSLTVKAEVNGSRARIMLHDSDYIEGRNRIDFREEGGIYFGAEERNSGTYPDKTEGLKRPSDTGFENRLGLEDYSYNISYLDLERGNLLPFKDIVAYNRETAIVGRYGNFSNATMKVRLWE